jgi:LPPG:FO 2-phospho-L-lactate transferase
MTLPNSASSPDRFINPESKGTTITVLCGGFGAARFVSGLLPVGAAESKALCCVVNTADDFDHVGLHVSPDLDTVTYALAGCFDEERGFGLVGDTFHCLDALGRYGDNWFALGDRDLAQHIERTALLASGASLQEVVERIAAAWGVPATILAMSNDAVRTVVNTGDGELTFQDFLVRRHAQPAVRAVRYHGIDGAHPTAGVLEALRSAEVVLIAPSNPVSSIGPVLALPGVRETLQRRDGPTVALTPVVSSQPPRTLAERRRFDLRAKLMGSTGSQHRATAVAELYRGLIDGFVLDIRDAAELPGIKSLGIEARLANTLAPAGEGWRALAASVLGFAAELSGSRRALG